MSRCRWGALLDLRSGRASGAFADSLAGSRIHDHAGDAPAADLLVVSNIKTLELIEGAVSAFEQEPGAARQ